MKTIVLLGAAIIAGAVRYPIEGPQVVQDAEADRLVENKLAKFEGDEDDDLDDLKVEDLKKLAETETVDLGTAKSKGDIIKAIRAHRAAAAE